MYSAGGQPALSPWRLALVRDMLFAEDLTERQAAEAVRWRLDWKYVLGLALTDPGFDYSVLSEFRGRLVAGAAIDKLLCRLLEVCQAHGLIKQRGQQRTDSTHILAAVRDLSRLELVGTSLQHTLNSLAVVVSEWLKTTVPANGSKRYAKRWEDYRLPTPEFERLELAEQVGRDGYWLLSACFDPTAAAWLRQIPALQTLRPIWMQDFYQEEGVVHWRRAGKLPPAAKATCSPFDTQARSSIKRQTEWTGYKVHLTDVWGDVAAFSSALWALASQHDVPYAGQVAVTADGAPWIWQLTNDLFPCAVQIVDWYHAAQHLEAAAHSHCSTDPAAAKRWSKPLKDHVFLGECFKVILALHDAQLSDHATYFETHQHRMLYPVFRADGFPIGSGSTESAVKQFKHRFCGPGMRWSHPGLQRLSLIRSALLDHTFDALWDAA
ncbi:MAG: transposase [Aggregatilineales bacterium]